MCVCVLGVGRKTFSAAAAFRAGGQHVQGGAGWGGSRERREGGSWQQMAQAGLGLSDKRVGEGWPSAPGGSLQPPRPVAEKELGEWEGHFY